MNNTHRNTCEYCHTNIKDTTEVIICPKCNTPYHKDCWEENKGCAVYGCGYSVNDNSENNRMPVEDLLVEIEFLINEKRYIEAINESKEYLRLDKKNIEIKKLYNRAVSLVNARTRLIEEGDKFYSDDDLENASVFYKRALEYCNDVDGSLLLTKLELIGNEIPKQKRRKRVSSYFAFLFSVLIVLLIAVVYYYFVAMEQPKEFVKIEKDDDLSDMVKTELQISRYENFVRKFKEGEWADKAVDKINYFSATIASDVYSDDWRTALSFLNKIDKTKAAKTFSEIDKKIFDKAMEELSVKINNARSFNSKKNYTEAKFSLQDAIDILDNFKNRPESTKRSDIISDIDLLNEKISSLVKYRSVTGEIEEKSKELVKLSEEKIRERRYVNTVQITGRVIAVSGNGILTIKSESNRRVVGVSTGSIRFTPGDYVTFECVRKGSFSFINDEDYEETIPLFEVVISDRMDRFTSLSEYEVLAIEQRLAYLKNEKQRLDSLFSVKLKVR